MYHTKTLTFTVISTLLCINIISCHNDENSEGWKVISSLEQMKHLVDFEHWVIHVFTIDEYKIDVDFIAKPKAVQYLRDLREHYSSSSYPYIHHPFNQYHIIRRFALQWKQWHDPENVCVEPNNKETWCWYFVDAYKTNIESNMNNNVNYEQVHFAIASMIVSKMVMDYPSENYIHGNISGVITPGLEAYEMLEFAAVSIGNNIKASILDLSVTLLFWLNTAVRSYISTHQGAELVNSEEEIVGIIFREKTDRLRGDILSEEYLETILEAAKNPTKELHRNLEIDFPSLCQEPEDRVSPTDRSKLYCRSLYRSVPYFAFRAEFLSLDPPVAVIHNFLDPKTLRKDTEFASHRLWPASVGNNTTHFSPTRVTQHAMLPLNKGNVEFYLEQSLGFRRSEEILGENEQVIGSMEPVTYINYGVQGYYSNHYDFIQFEIPAFHNRMATFMWYASDVKSGGATVFPYLGVVSQPKRGKALFWFNFRDGRPDYRLLHAACPIGVGNKWIATVWIREFGHEHLSVCRADSRKSTPGRLEDLIDLRNYFQSEHTVRDVHEHEP